MKYESAIPPPAADSVRSRHLSPTASFYLLASIPVSLLAGSSAPTPLYPRYQTMWGFSSMTVTVIFGIYAIAVLVSLLIAGRLSEHVGRKKVLIVATIIQAATMLLFAVADGLSDLLFARVLQGLTTGAAMAAVGAGMMDIDHMRGATANAVAPPIGTALGGVVAGLMVRYLPAPTHLVYVVLSAVFIAQSIGIFLMKESASLKPGAWTSLKPHFNFPIAVHSPLLRAMPALVATWSLAGFYGGMAPALIRDIFGLDAGLLGGLALFVLAGCGGVCVLLLQRREARSMLLFGTSMLMVGLSLVIVALYSRSVTLFFIGTVLAGIGFGATFQGSVRSIMPFAAPTERAGVLSIIFVVSYLAMGVPVVIAGYFLTQKGNVMATAEIFSTVMLLLSTIALVGALKKDGK